MLKDFLLEETILIGVITNEQREEKAKEYLSELAFLTTTAGGQVQKTFMQKLNMPNILDICNLLRLNSMR